MLLTSEFDERHEMIQALRRLKASGVAATDIDVFSDQPLELPRDALARSSHMSLAVVTGAILFGLLVVGFVYYTQHDYPLITGGMPIFSFWATGVVFYELTMLGAIITSLIWFLYESGLVAKKRQPAPSFDAGKLCLRIRCNDNQETEFRSVLQLAGGANVRAEGQR